MSADKGLLCAAIVLIQRIVPIVAASGLFTQVLNLVSDLLADVRAAGCGGSKAYASRGPGAATGIGRSDAQVLQIHVAFPAPIFQPKTGGGTSFTQMTDPGVAASTLVGEPEVPTKAVQFAVPVGADVNVKVLGSSGYDLTDVNLWPAQESDVAPVAEPLPTRLNPPFAQNQTTYSSVNLYPPSLTTTSPVTTIRDLRTASVIVSGARFTPRARILHVVTSVDLELRFTGPNTGSFGPVSILEPWERDARSVYESSMANFSAVSDHLTPIHTLPRICGEQLLIVASPETRAPADTLAAARNADGIKTQVVEVGAPDVGSSPASIRNFIAGELHSACAVHPRYVVLMGNAPAVPTWLYAFKDTAGASNWYEPDAATDVPYGFIHQSAQVDAGAITDFTSDLAVGRITGDGPAATRAVDKIIAYEDRPTSQASFYQNATSAAFFQSCPDISCLDAAGNAEPQSKTQETVSFLQSADRISTSLTFAGKTVDRQWSKNDSDTPEKFLDGSPIPAGITYGAGGPSIRAGLDAGRFLIFHNDHGFSNGNGWAQPYFPVGSIDLLKNAGLYPVMWSLDCSSGDFDRHTPLDPGFTGAALAAENAGAVGLVASTRISSIYWGGRLGVELANAAFPQFQNAVSQDMADQQNQRAPVFGGGTRITPVHYAAVTRLGDTTNVAMAATMATTDLVTDTHARGTALEFNTFGDPTMYMRTAPPKFFHVDELSSTLVDSTHVRVTLPNPAEADGANVTLVKDHRYLGRAVLSGGQAIVPSGETLSGLNGLQVILQEERFVSDDADLGDATRPLVSSVSPDIANPGESVSITGSGLVDVTAVTFGSTPATSFSWIDADHLSAVVPPGSGAVAVTVTTSAGASTVAPGGSNTFTYRFNSDGT